MSKEENKFDLWLQDQLEGHESQLAHGSWSAASRARKRRKWFFIALISCSSLAASLILGYYIGRETAPQATETSQTIASENSDTPNETLAKPEELEPNSNELPASQDPTPNHTIQTTPREKLNTPEATVTLKAPQEPSAPQVQIPDIHKPIFTGTLGSLNSQIHYRPKWQSLTKLDHRFNLNPSLQPGGWDISVEAGIALLQTKGLGPWANFYDELMKDQIFLQQVYGLGTNYNAGFKKWQFSLGLNLNRVLSKTVYQNRSRDTFNSASSGGSGGLVISQAQDALSDQTLEISYNSLSLPVRAYYQLHTFKRLELMAGIGLNLNYNFNQYKSWYSAMQGSTLVAQDENFSKWNFGQEFLLSAGYRLRSNSSIRLSYVLSTPRGNVYENEEYAIRSGWQHSLRLHYYIP